HFLSVVTDARSSLWRGGTRRPPLSFGSDQDELDSESRVSSTPRTNVSSPASELEESSGFSDGTHTPLSSNDPTSVTAPAPTNTSAATMLLRLFESITCTRRMA